MHVIKRCLYNLSLKFALPLKCFSILDDIPSSLTPFSLSQSNQLIWSNFCQCVFSHQSSVFTLKCTIFPKLTFVLTLQLFFLRSLGSALFHWPPCWKSVALQQHLDVHTILPQWKAIKQTIFSQFFSTFKSALLFTGSNTGTTSNKNLFSHIWIPQWLPLWSWPMQIPKNHFNRNLGLWGLNTRHTTMSSNLGKRAS